MTATTDCSIVGAIDKAIDHLVDVRNKAAELLTENVVAGWRCSVFVDHLIFSARHDCKPDPKMLARAIGENWMSFGDSWRGSLKGIPSVTVTINIDQPAGRAVDLS